MSPRIGATNPVAIYAATCLGARCRGDSTINLQTKQACSRGHHLVVAAFHAHPLWSYSPLRPSTTCQSEVTPYHWSPLLADMLPADPAPHCHTADSSSHRLPSMTPSSSLPPPLTALGSRASHSPSQRLPPPPLPCIAFAILFPSEQNQCKQPCLTPPHLQTRDCKRDLRAPVCSRIIRV